MEMAYESSDENVFTVDAEGGWSPNVIVLNATGSSDDTATFTAKIIDKTTHEVLASDSKGVLIITEHPTDPYFEFQSEDVADGESYESDYCENGKTMHVIAFNYSYESTDEIFVRTTPENTPLTITKEIVNPETASDDIIITVSGVNNTSEDITIEVGDTFYSDEEVLATFTIKAGGASPTIVSDDITAGATYPNTYFVGPKSFTVANKPAGSTLTISYDHGGFTLNGDDTEYNIAGVNVETTLATIQFLLDGVSFAEIYVEGKTGP